jgi:ankyrin repeat protein
MDVEMRRKQGERGNNSAAARNRLFSMHSALSSGELSSVPPGLQLDDQLGFYDALDTNGDRYHETLLCAAARLGRPASVRLLVDADASVDVVDEGSQTPLHLACAGETRSGFVRSCTAQDCLAMVTTLLDAGADVNARDECGCTPLHYVMIRVADDCHFARSEKRRMQQQRHCVKRAPM